MEALGATASVLTIIQVAAKVTSLCVKYSSAIKNAKADIERLRIHVDSLRITLDNLQTLLQDQHGARLETLQNLRLRGALGNTHSQLAHLAARLEDRFDGDGNKDSGRRAKAMRSLGLRWRALEWPLESREIEHIIESLQRDQNIFSSALHIDQATHVLDINCKIDLSKLPVARGAASNSQANEHEPRCHPDTRVSVLADVFKWIEDPCEKCIFWLYGMAGTGKSTVSRTVSASSSDKKILNASFFFKKGEGDRGSAAMFFTTIACQLVHQLPCLVPHVQGAIKKDPAIANKSKKEQFEKLILEPLEACKDDPRVPALILVVIDALDECDREDDTRTIIRLLSRAKEVTSIRLRFFVTSRPELPIRLGFQDIGDSYTDLALHEIPAPDIEKDISMFLRFRLAQIRDEFNQAVLAGSRLPSDWPSAESVQHLVKMAVPLFIFASTACRFIADLDCGDPEEQMNKILEYQEPDGFSQLHMTYLPILGQLLLKRTDSGLVNRTEGEKADIVAWFREIVGAIVVIVDPLSTMSLARLLGVSQRAVDSRLARLHSVLHIPHDPHAPVKLLHLSFRDFLVNHKNRNANPFWVNEGQTHAKLAIRCLQLLSTGGNLRRDICGLRIPAKPRSELDPRIIDSCLPPEVQYACLHWVYHLKQSKCTLRDGNWVHRFLTRHFLHWLEALSIVGRIGGVVSMVDDLMGLLEPESSSGLIAFLWDARRIIFSYRSVIDACPLQVYHSAIIFAPDQSEVRKTFENQAPLWLSLFPKVDKRWDACLQVFENHGDYVDSVSFSPDGSLLASASRDIDLWDVATGVKILTLHRNGDNEWVSSVAFSPKSNCLASASGDPESTVPWIVKLWDVATGGIIRAFDGHNSRVNSVAFSPDGRLLASASGDYGAHPDSDDRTINVWNVETGGRVFTFKGHDGWIESVVFSPDGILLASASNEDIKLWDVHTGDFIREIEGSMSVAFSPDGRRLASAPNCSIKLWDVGTGRNIATFGSCHYDTVGCLAFSRDGRWLASASHDWSVILWNVATASAITMLDNHCDTSSVAFSPDSRWLAAGSNGIIKMWDVTVKTHVTAPDNNHGDYVRQLIFSPANNRLASHAFGSIRLWDTETGDCIKTLMGGPRVREASVSPNGNLLALATHASTENVTVWDIATGKCVAELSGHWIVAFSWDGSQLASLSDDKTMKVWDVVTGSHIMSFDGHNSFAYSAAFSPDGSLFASGSGDIKLWDTKTGGWIRTFNGHSTCARSIAFSPDGSRLASSSGDWVSIRFWDITTGCCIATLNAGTYIDYVAFDATGSLLKTEIGTFVVNLPPSPQTTTTAEALDPPPQAVIRQGIGLSPDKTWITWNSQRVLWLPPAYRPGSSAVAGSTVAIGCPSGRVILLSFSAIDSLLFLQADERP